MFNDSGSDKSSGHSYHEIYSKILPEKISSLLEVGIANDETPGRSSLHAWSKIYPEAKIYGADIIAEKLINENNITSYLVDQSSAASLYQLSNDIWLLDVIIDDGSHILTDSIQTFNFLKNNMKVNSSIYVIEDVGKISPPYRQTLSGLENFFSSNSEQFSYKVYDAKPGITADDSVLIVIRKLYA